MIHRKTFRLFATAAILSFSSCATMEPELALDPGAEKVRLFMSEQRDCKFVSEVNGQYIANEPYEETDEKARVLLKNAALAAKANAVVIISIDRRLPITEKGHEAPGYTKILGSAYNCRYLDSR